MSNKYALAWYLLVCYLNTAELNASLRIMEVVL